MNHNEKGRGKKEAIGLDETELHKQTKIEKTKTLFQFS